MMDPELLKQLTKEANATAQRWQEVAANDNLRAGLSSVAIAQPIMKIPTLSGISSTQPMMITPIPENMPTFQSWIQELNKALKSISEAINRAVAAFMRFFGNIARRLQRAGIIERKPRAHKHRQSVRRMHVYALRSL